MNQHPSSSTPQSSSSHDNTASAHLGRILQSELALREAELDFFAPTTSDAEREKALREAVDRALALEASREQDAHLERLVDLCAQVESQAMVHAMFQMLDTERDSVRIAAAEAILDVAFDRYVQVAKATEHWLDTKHEGPGVAEVPAILAEVGEPSALPLIRRFLAFSHPEVVVAAIEALVVLGDPEATKWLTPLTSDKRLVDLFGDDESQSTVGELAAEAIDALQTHA